MTTEQSSWEEHAELADETGPRSRGWLAGLAVLAIVGVVVWIVFAGDEKAT